MSRKELGIAGLLIAVVTAVGCWYLLGPQSEPEYRFSTINRDVSRPGAFAIPEGQKLTVLQLIASAGIAGGDNTVFEVQITDRNGRVDVVTIDFKQENRDIRYVEEGDVLVVKSVARDTLNLVEPVANEFVYIEGDVRLPGAFKLTNQQSEPISMRQLIASVGPRCEPDDRVEITRVSADYEALYRTDGSLQSLPDFNILKAGDRLEVRVQ
ncbi:MAG: hypothetical protein RIG82_10320 [Phycisphaeraceae bacterium]